MPKVKDMSRPMILLSKVCLLFFLVDDLVVQAIVLDQDSPALHENSLYVPKQGQLAVSSQHLLRLLLRL